MDRAPERGRGRMIAATLGVLRRAADARSAAWFALAAACVTFGGLAAGLAPLALKGVVDDLASPGPAAAGVLTPLAAYVGLAALQRLFEQAQAYAYGRGEQRLSRRLGVRAFEHMLRLPLAFHHGARSGALAQTLTEAAAGLRLVLAHLVITVAPLVVQLLVASVVLASIFQGPTGAVLVVALTAYAIVFAWGVARLDGPARAIAQRQVEAGGVTADGLMNVEAIKTFTAERRFAARYEAILTAREGEWRRYLGRRLSNGLAVAVVFSASIWSVLSLAATDPAAAAGSFVLLNAYVLQLVRPLEMLGFAVRDMGQGLASLERLLAILDQPTEAGGDAALARTPGAADVEFEDVSFAFSPSRPLLRGLSFRAPAGARVAIVGPSGSGKSSLLRLILRLHEPDGGEIRLDGRPIREAPLDALRRQIAVVSQDTILFNDTVGANVALAVEQAESADIRRALADARLSELIEALPLGLDTPVGERGLQLSGGERQRVAIARAALKTARLILLDEATAALDPETEAAVWAAMEGLTRQATTLLVTHRLAAACSADLILVLDGGRIVERGRHAELLRRGGAYARMWRTQAGEAAAAPAASA